MKKLGLLEVLEGIEDSRRERSVWYPLHEVLFIFIAAVICGATSYVKVEMFGKSKEKWLKKYIQLENGVPDACTFRNVVKAIDTQQLHTVFIEWMAVCSMSEGDFTAAGHFIVIYGYDSEGFLVNDPNCVARSRQHWSWDSLRGQIKNMWLYQKG